MTDKELQKKYPEIWNTVYISMQVAIVNPEDDCITEEQIKVICHNAAFLACSAHHQVLSKGYIQKDTEDDQGKEYDIKETKEAFVLVFKIIKASIAANKDGKINAFDAIKFLPVLTKVMSGLSGIQLIGKEVADMDEDEHKEIEALIEKEFEIDDLELKAIIKSVAMGALRLGSDVANLIEEISERTKKDE